MTKSAEFEVPLNVSGLPTIRNRGAFSWNSNGLIAVGSATDILIIDSESLSPVQVINSEHKSSINRVIWNPFARQLTDPKPCKYHADLITTDTLNNLLVWDVEKGQILSTFIHPESKQLLDIKWSTGPDTWKRTKIFLLYSSNLFVIYDVLNHHSFQNIQIFEPQGVDLTSFDSNPYSAGTSTTLAFLGEGYVSLAKFDPIKSDKILVTASIPLTKAGHYMPNNNGSPLSHGHGQPMSSHSHSDLTSSMSMSLSTSAQNPNLTLLSSIGKRQSSSASIRKLVSDIIVGPENPMNQIIVRFGTLEFLRSMKDHLIVWTSREIYLVNTHFHVILNVLSLEKSVTSIVNIIPCRTRPALFTLHENGTLFLRKYTINNGNSHHNHNLTISLDTTCANENPRFSSKKSEVLGGCLDPSENESKFTMYLSDGRFVSYTVGPGKLDKGLGKKSEASEPSKLLLPTPITPADPTLNFNIDSTYATTGPTSIFTSTVQKSSSENISTVSGAKIKLSSLVKGILNLSENSASNADPSVKLKLKRVTTSVGQVSCLKSMGKGTLFAGTSTGHVLMIKCGKGNNGIIGGAPKAPRISKKYSLHSNSPVSGIELISDDEILTWANLSFSANPKCELCLTEVNVGGSKMLKQDEPSHIGAVRVSPLKQYFLIVYKNGSAPCELWDLPRRQLIKMLPSKLPPITCVQWKEATEGSKEETFFMTDLGTFLFTFRVDGNRFSNATCVKLDTGNMGGIPVALFTRGDLVFRGDSSGTLVIYNTDKKTASAGVNLGRGPLFKILEFTDYFIAQFSDQLELWDLNAVQKLRLLHSNKLKSTDISLVNDSFLAVLIKNSGGLKFLPVNTASSSAGDWYPTVRKEGSLLTNYPHYWTHREKCRGILEFVKIKNDGKSCDKIDPKDFLALVQKLSLEPDEVKFWSIVVHSMSIKGKDWTSGDVADVAPIDPDVFSVGRTYKEILVRIAQCVWIVDSKKREDVGRTLILSGESEKSAEILLDTDPSDAKNYIANGLKAAVSVGCKEMPEATKAVLKIVATNLIASGQHDEGLELLCMLHKHSEACKYIESANDWEKALLLCKTSLSDPPANVQGNETLSKYAQFLNTNRFVMKAASLFVYIQKYDRAVEVLFGARKRHLAYVLLHICEVNKYHIPVSDHIKLAIRLDFARFLFDMGLAKEAIGFCEALGDEGKDVKAELEILSS